MNEVFKNNRLRVVTSDDKESILLLDSESGERILRIKILCDSGQGYGFVDELIFEGGNEVYN